MRRLVTVLHVRLQLIFFNGAVEGLTAAFYAVLELSHCEAFSCVAQTAEARRCTPALRSPLACDWSRAELFLCSRAMFKSSSERLPSVSIPRRFSSVLASATS